MDSIREHVAAIERRVKTIETTLNRLNPPSREPGGSTFRSMVGANMPPRMTPDELRPTIDMAANQYGIRPELLQAMIQQESGFKADAVSPKGAMGLMQLMPSTAAGLGVNDPFDPEQNILGGARYLRQNLDRFNGNEEMALAAYNAGPGTVLHYHGVPPYAETQQYVNSILANATRQP